MPVVIIEDGLVLIIEMSQSPTPSNDKQALLQSMLQRLKLQTPGTTTQFQSEQYSKVEQNAQTSDLQTINNNPVNGFEPMDNLKRGFAINGDIEELNGSSVDSGQISPFQTGQLIFPKLSKDTASISSDGSASIANFELKKDMASVFETGESTRQIQDQNSSFVPRTYAWSMKNSDGQDINKVPFGGEGMFGATGQQTPFFSGTNTANDSKQRSSENKTRRWTQKIKEKWRERPGSFGKRGKHEIGSPDKTKPEHVPQYRLLTTENGIPISNEVSAKGTPDNTDHSKSLTPVEDGSDEYMRYTTDFEVGLGSFSLLDEITSGQEWAPFLSPANLVSSQEKPSKETIDQPRFNHLESNSTSNPMSEDAGNTLGTTRFSQNTDVAMAPRGTLPVSMEPVQNQVRPEPMDHGQSQLNMLMTSEQQPRPQRISRAELRNRVDTLTLKANKNNLGRKRQHDSSERIEAKLRKLDLNLFNGNDTVDDGSVFLPDNHGSDRIDGSQYGKTMAVSSPCSPVPKGVLKHSSSYDTETSMETETKKRVEGTRRVRFSEEILSFHAPELGPDMSDSEEDSNEEEETDSLIEEDSEEHLAPAVIMGYPSVAVRPEEAAPSRRPALPAWIRALRKKNSGKKPR